MNVEILARIQFAFTTAFHYIFPPLSIGLGLILVIMESAWIRTGNPAYKKITHFWVKVFALIFGMGVASGIVLEFQFGTNWSTYSRYVGDIFGSALAAEGVFAFFLESGFLAVLVFGWDRVSPKVHFLSTVLVWLGSTFSAVWIIVANSWMQTPAGYKIVGEGMNARANITDFWAMVFNPSSMDRLSHTVSGCWVTGAMFVASVSAYYLLKGKHTDFAKFSMKVAIPIALIAGILQAVTGHQSAVGVAQNQPAKLAALEGHYDSKRPLDLIAFGWVDESAKEVRGIKMPGLGSLLLYGDANRPVTGLDAFRDEDRPAVQPVFQAFHAMVGIGIALILISLVSYFLLIRGKLWTNRMMLTILVGSVVLPQLANQLGWLAAEMGRQPWIVYNMLRINEGLSKVVSANQVAASLIGFLLIYALLFALFIYLLDKKIKEGPDETTDEAIDADKFDPIGGVRKEVAL
jgi:cytochrome d ubiquinol oxidase subunit I